MSGALSKHNRLLGEAAVAAKAAREIAEKAEADNGREMTADERKEFDAKFDDFERQMREAFKETRRG